MLVKRSKFKVQSLAMMLRTILMYPRAVLKKVLGRSLVSRVTVKSALESQVLGGNICVCGWVKSVRKQKDFTFVNISDGSSLHSLQLLAPTESIPCTQELSIGCSVLAKGKITASTHPSQRLEMQVIHLHILGDCDPVDYPFKLRARHTGEYVRGFPHLRSRTATFSSLLRIRHSAMMAVHSFFQRNGFLHCHTPILSSSDCEGAGEMFEVRQYGKEAEFFDHKAFLTVSGQFHAEALASGMMSVYSFGPTFRAEKSHTRRHLAEFYMVEAETITLGDDGLETLMKLIEDLVSSTVTAIQECNEEDVRWFYNEAEKSKVRTLLTQDLDTPFKRMSYTEAIQRLQNSNDKFQFEPKWGSDLQGEHEQYLVSHCDHSPLFITDFPASIKPFYAKRNEVPRNDCQTVASLDLLVPGVGEIVGGTLREDRYDILRDKLESSEEKIQQYQWYLDLRRFGTIPHGGFGLGFERLLQAILGIENIKDTIPFPRYAGSCQL